MAATNLHKLVFSVLLPAALLTSCNGQNPVHPKKPETTETAIASHATLAKTQGSKKEDNVHCSLQDKAGNLWFGTTGEGVYRYDGKQFTQFTKKDGLSSNCVYAILEDRAGAIWFGTANGVCRSDGKIISHFPLTVAAYDLYPNHSSTNNTPANNEVWAITQDKRGNIWFGTTDGVYVFNGLTLSRFPGQSILNSHRLQLKWVQCILEDNSGTIWMGSGPIAMEGVIRYDGQTLSSSKPSGDGWIRNMLTDKNGTVWFGGRAHGNFTYDGKRFTNFTAKSGIGNPVLVDRAGNIWFCGEEKLSTGENEGGIWCYNGKTFKNYGKADGLGPYSVWSMLQDSEGNIWIGTRNTGLYKFDGKTFTCFSE